MIRALVLVFLSLYILVTWFLLYQMPLGTLPLQYLKLEALSPGYILYSFYFPYPIFLLDLLLILGT